MAAGTPLSAKNAKIRINNQILFGAKWEVKPETNFSDTSNFEGAGFEDQVGCLRKIEADIEGWWDGGANMHDAPLSIQDGQRLLNVKLFVNDVAGPFWLMAKADVKGVPVTADVKDKIMYRLSLKGSGVFVYPTGNAA